MGDTDVQYVCSHLVVYCPWHNYCGDLLKTACQYHSCQPGVTGSCQTLTQ